MKTNDLKIGTNQVRFEYKDFPEQNGAPMYGIKTPLFYYLLLTSYVYTNSLHFFMYSIKTNKLGVLCAHAASTLTGCITGVTAEAGNPRNNTRCCLEFES